MKSLSFRQADGSKSNIFESKLVKARQIKLQTLFLAEKLTKKIVLIKKKTLELRILGFFSI